VICVSLPELLKMSESLSAVKGAVLLAGFVPLATSCTSGSSSSPLTSVASSQSAAPSTSPSNPALPFEGLSIGARTSTDGWVVMADGYGVHVAGGGTLAASHD
jgi:hypothetical protein